MEPGKFTNARGIGGGQGSLQANLDYWLKRAIELGPSCEGWARAVAQNRGIQLRKVESTVEGNHDIRGILGADSDVRNGFNDVKVTFQIDADASKEEIEALVAQSQKRSAVFDALTNPTEVTVEVA